MNKDSVFLVVLVGVISVIVLNIIFNFIMFLISVRNERWLK